MLMQTKEYALAMHAYTVHFQEEYTDQNIPLPLDGSDDPGEDTLKKVKNLAQKDNSSMEWRIEVEDFKMMLEVDQKSM